MGLGVYKASDEDDKVKRSVGTTVSDGVQMSHLWISRKIDSSQIVTAHDNLLDAIAAWERVEFKPSSERVFKDGKVKLLRLDALMIEV